MFGIKKDPLDFEEKHENIEVEKDGNAKFIFYGSDKKFTKKIEFYAVLNSDPMRKLLIIVNCDSSIDFLSLKLAEAFEGFPEFKDLDGLRAINITKKNDDLSEIPIPSSGTVNEHIKNGDYIYFDLITKEYWVKTIVKLQTLNNLNEISLMFDLKLGLDMKLIEVKYFIIKCGINCWLENLENIRDNLTFFIFQILFISKNKKDMGNTQTVRELFTFKSEIECHITLSPLEEQLMFLLQKLNLKHNSINRARWFEFREINFISLKNSKKFVPEFVYIQNYIKKLFKFEKSKIEEIWYLYKKNLPFEDDDFKFQENTINNVRESDISKSSILSKKIIILFPGNSNDNNNNNCNKNEEKEIINIDNPNTNKFIDISQSMRNQNILSETSSKKSSKISYERTEKSNSFYSHGENIMFPNKNERKKSIELHLSDKFMNNLKQDMKSENKENFSEYENENMDVESQISNITIKNQKSEKESNFFLPLIPDEQKKFNFNQKPTKNSTNIKHLINQFRTTSNYNNLVNEFKGKITYQTFLNSIKSLYMPMLSKDYIEKITIPEFRNFQILPKNAKLNSEYQEEEDENEQNKLIKRINCKVGVFLIGFLILLICSILLVFKFD